MALGSYSGIFSTNQRKPYQRGLGMQPAQPAQQVAQPGQLQAPQPMTQNGALAQQKNLQGLQTGQFGDVQSAQNATNRANALRQYQAIQLSRGAAVRGNLSTEQAQRAQDQSLAAANAQNLTAQNSVNALQRQYGQDALNRADTYENTAYSRGTNERAYGDSRADLGYERATDEARYGDSRADVQYGRDYQAGRDAVGDKRYDTEYTDKRGDIQYGRGIDESRYADTRADVKYGQDYQASRDAVGDKRYDTQYADERGDVQYQRGYQENRDAIGDTRYTDATQYSRGRDAIGDQRYDASTAYNQSRDALGDQRYDASTAYTQSRDALGDQRYDQTYQDQRGDITYNRDEAQRLEGKGDVNALISSVTDPRAQNLLRGAQARGEDVQALYNQMFQTSGDTGSQGTLAEGYRSASPAQQALDSKADELKVANPIQSGETQEQYTSRITDMARKAITAETTVKDATTQDAAMDRLVAQKMSSGATVTPEEKAYAVQKGLVNTYTAKTLPTYTAANALKGQPVNVDGEVYTVVGGDRYISDVNGWGLSRHTDYTVLDKGGQKVYMVNGKIQTNEPKDV
jgi:hypothetical protein